MTRVMGLAMAVLALSGCDRVVASSPDAQAKRELSAMAERFLVDYFGHSAVSPADTLVDFCDACPGKADERSDVETNRRLLTIQSASARVDRVTVYEMTGEADILASCEFHDTLKSTGKAGTTRGNCLLTGIYRDGRWWLCDSTMHGLRTCDDGTDDCNVQRDGR